VLELLEGVRRILEAAENSAGDVSCAEVLEVVLKVLKVLEVVLYVLEVVKGVRCVLIRVDS